MKGSVESQVPSTTEAQKQKGKPLCPIPALKHSTSIKTNTQKNPYLFLLLSQMALFFRSDRQRVGGPGQWQQVTHSENVSVCGCFWVCDVFVCTHSQTCVPYLPVCVKVRNETEKREKLSFGHIYSSAHPIPHCNTHTH